MGLARGTPEDLRLACSSSPDVELFESERTVTLRSVTV
jgi:hypothetical protein